MTLLIRLWCLNYRTQVKYSTLQVWFWSYVCVHRVISFQWIVGRYTQIPALYFFPSVLYFSLEVQEDRGRHQIYCRIFLPKIFEWFLGRRKLILIWLNSPNIRIEICWQSLKCKSLCKIFCLMERCFWKFYSFRLFAAFRGDRRTRWVRMVFMWKM